MSPTETQATATSATQPVEATTSANGTTAPANGAAAPETEDNALLAQLVAAMREVAERERASSVAGLQASVKEATTTLSARADTAAEELRKRADEEIAGIGDWVKLETERVAAEGDRKIETRRQLLSQELSEHEQASQQEIQGLNERVAEYERELASFFAQLNEITDPAAFGNAAKRMPRAPVLAAPEAAEAAAASQATPSAPAEASSAQADAPAAETNAATGTDATEATATSADAADAPAATTDASDPAATADATETTTPAADDPAPTTAPSDTAADPEAKMVAEHRIRLDALGIARDETTEAEAETTAEEAPAEDADSDETLRARLAELDVSLGQDEAKADAPAETKETADGSEVATAIVVHGLGSFGAITSFKQALERVDGVHGISLSLGPTGEFVYRATHDAGFDLVAAIEGIESGTAQIERQPDGSLRVNVTRSR